MAAYTYGEAIDANDLLPMISPLTGMVRLAWTTDQFNAELRARGATAQSRISQVLQPENATPAWVTFDVSATWTISEHLRATASFTNLADILYHEHTSINDVASRGRSVLIGLQSTW